MPRALLLSPHAGDVAFSCAATARHLLRGGWDVQLVTIFTDSRAETNAFCEIIGLENYGHWDFAERTDGDDEFWRAIAENLRSMETPDTVFAPQGLGENNGFAATMRAVLECGWAEKTFWYRDVPAAMTQPDATPCALLPQPTTSGFVGFDEAELDVKIAGCLAFPARIAALGGAEEFARALREFHLSEAQAAGRDEFVERFLVGV